MVVAITEKGGNRKRVATNSMQLNSYFFAQKSQTIDSRLHVMGFTIRGMHFPFLLCFTRQTTSVGKFSPDTKTQCFSRLWPRRGSSWFVQSMNEQQQKVAPVSQQDEKNHTPVNNHTHHTHNQHTPPHTPPPPLAFPRRPGSVVLVCRPTRHHCCPCRPLPPLPRSLRPPWAIPVESVGTNATPSPLSPTRFQ